MLTREQINQIRSSSGLPINTNKENYVGKYDYLKTEEKPGTFSRIISQSATAIKERGQEVKEAFTKSKEGKISPIQGAGRIVGSTIAGAGDILFNVIKEGVRAISPQAVEGVKKGFEKVGETEIVQNISSIYNNWASKNPEAAKDLNAVLNIASVLPAQRAAMLGGKATVKGTTKGIEKGLKSAGTGLKVLGTSGEKAGKTLVSAAFPPKEVAGRVLSYKAKTPLSSRFKQAMEGVERAPITPADVVIKYNLPTASRSGIGIKAKRVADNLFENQVKPVLKGIKEKVSKKEVFDGIQKTINKEVDISRRKALQTAFDALSYDYKKVSGWSVKTLDDIKSGLTRRLPSKVWKGQDIAGDMNNIRKMFSDEARKSIRKRLPQNVINIYDDYGALKEVSKMGEKALQTGLNQGMIGLAGEALRITTVPVAAALGTGISKAGTALRKLGTKLNTKKVNLKNIKPGLTIKDVTKPLPKGKGEILKTTPKTTPLKSKVSDFITKAYKEAPLAKAEIDNIASKIAKKYNGTLASAPLKKQEKVIFNINNKYNGDYSRVSDIARNTIIVSPDDTSKVFKELQKNPNYFSGKFIDPKTDPLGYSGYNTKYRASNGHIAEIQINTPEMIYAKEPAESAIKQLGDKLYNQLNKQYNGIGGKGHLYYDEWAKARASQNISQANKIEKTSSSYYNLFR